MLAAINTINCSMEPDNENQACKNNIKTDRAKSFLESKTMSDAVDCNMIDGLSSSRQPAMSKEADVLGCSAVLTKGSAATPSVDVQIKSKRTRRIRWSSITVHEFGVGLGGSSVSDRGGPSIGLGEIPEFTWTTPVGEMAERSEGLHRFTPEERVQMLRAAGVSNAIIARYARETKIILSSRKRTLLDTAEEDENRTTDEMHEAKRQRYIQISSNEVEFRSKNPHYHSRRPRMVPTNLFDFDKKK